MKMSRLRAGAATLAGMILVVMLSAHTDPFSQPVPSNCTDIHEVGVYGCKYSGESCNMDHENMKLRLHCYQRCCWTNGQVSSEWEATSSCTGYGCEFLSTECCDTTGTCAGAYADMKADPLKQCPVTQPPGGGGGD